MRHRGAPAPYSTVPLLAEQPDGDHRSALFLAMLEMANAAPHPPWSNRNVSGPSG